MAKSPAKGKEKTQPEAPAKDAPETVAPKLAPPSEQPKFRMANPKKALAVINAAAKRTKHHVEQDRMVEDAYDRMPPIDPAELDNDATGWRTNVDYGDTENAVNEKVELIVNLMTLPMPFLDFRVRKRVMRERPGVMDALATLALEHHTFLSEQPCWTMEGQKMGHNMVATGLGIFHFPEPYSWHFESQPRTNLIYPVRCGLNPEKWDWMALRKSISIVELIKKLGAPEKAATDRGWNMAKIRAIIGKLKHEETFPGGAGLPNPDQDPEGYVNALQENDLALANENGNHIKGYTLYVKEYDGKITEHILVDDEAVGFIYDGKHRYDRMTQFLILFPLSLGQGFLEKVRGLGHRLLPFNALLNDVTNRTVDLSILSGGLMLKGTKDDGLQDVSQLLMGGLVTMIPPEYELDQRSFGNPAQGLMAVGENLRNHREANNRVFGGANGANRPEITATHAKLKYNEATRGNAFETDRFYLQLKLFHQTLWSRLLYFNEKGETSVPCEGSEEAQAFWKEVADEGVTKQDLDAIRQVLVETLFGDGDPNQVFMALSELSPIMPSLPVSAQRDALKRLIAARTRKPHLAESWLPTQSNGDRARSHQNWRTSVEEDAFENGSPMPVQDDDVTSIHAENHTKYAESVIQSFGQKVLKPNEALKRLILVRDHTTLHLTMLQRSKMDEALARDLGTRWKNILNMMRRMEQMVQEQQEAERQQMLEELRNPKLTVAERESAITEQFKRDEFAKTEDFRRQQIGLTESTKRDVLTKGALTKVQLEAMLAAPLLTESATPDANT
jgi:hypothetical protein